MRISLAECKVLHISPHQIIQRRSACVISTGKTNLHRRALTTHNAARVHQGKYIKNCACILGWKSTGQVQRKREKHC
ncbi:hypothetical protein OS493_016185 [Desmophyllum pertusum]|uniref:Uncharacterized protein n=1 Tax=Desmophyllum pertusum TaxID=174260 RepID=A0A9X0DBE3_9CNID|nr:hypothetical protein OS493_016185 [Desmophyllum pertusum]